MLTELRRFRSMNIALCLALVGSTIPFPILVAEAQESVLAPTENLGSSLDQARERIKTGDYDGAIEILRVAIEQARNRYDALRDAYLLLAKTHVILGNDYRYKPQGRSLSEGAYKEAKQVVAECLRTKELRHTYPEPASEYPEKMIQLFAEVRGEIFGSFRVAELDPPGAVALLDADTLRKQSDGLIGDVDLAIGPHLVVVRAQGYKDLTEEISISPNSTVERPYRLAKRRSGKWYATVGTGAAGVVAGVVALIGKDKTTPPEPDKPLPGAPAPPPNP